MCAKMREGDKDNQFYGGLRRMELMILRYVIESWCATFAQYHAKKRREVGRRTHPSGKLTPSRGRSGPCPRCTLHLRAESRMHPVLISLLDLHLNKCKDQLHLSDRAHDRHRSQVEKLSCAS